MDPSLSLPSFNIPKIKRQTSKDNLRIVNIASRDAQEILQTITRSFLDHTYKGAWQVTSTHLVQNKELEETYRSKRAQLKDEGRQARELAEQYAFLLVKDQNLIPKVSKIGLKTRYFPYNALGDSKFGIYVCRHADVQFRLADTWQIDNFSLIVFKVTLGRCKALNSQNSDISIEPTPNFDCHVHQYPAHSSNSDKMQLVRSQVYLYEYNEDAEPSDRPRHCLPTAVVQYQKTYGPGDSPSIYTPKPQNPYSTPKGSSENTPSARRGDRPGRSFPQDQDSGPPGSSKSWNKDPRKPIKGSSKNRSQGFTPAPLQSWTADGAQFSVQGQDMSAQQVDLVSTDLAYGSTDPNVMYQQDWSNNPNTTYFAQPEAGTAAWAGQGEQLVMVPGAWQGQISQPIQQQSVLGQDAWQGQLQQQIQQSVVGQAVWPDQSEQQIQKSGIMTPVWPDQISQETAGSWTGDKKSVGGKVDKESLQKLKNERRDPRLRGRKSDNLSSSQTSSPSLTQLDDGNQDTGMCTTEQANTQSYNPTFGPVQYAFGPNQYEVDNALQQHGMYPGESGPANIQNQADAYYNNPSMRDSLFQNPNEQNKSQMVQGNMQFPQQFQNIGMPFVSQEGDNYAWSNQVVKQVSMYEDSPQFSPVSDTDVNEPTVDELMTPGKEEMKESQKSSMYTTEKTGLYPQSASTKITPTLSTSSKTTEKTKKARTQISLEAYKARRVKVEEPKQASPQLEEQDEPFFEETERLDQVNSEQVTYKSEGMVETSAPVLEQTEVDSKEIPEPIDNRINAAMIPVKSTQASAVESEWNSVGKGYEMDTVSTSFSQLYPPSDSRGIICTSSIQQVPENVYSTSGEKAVGSETLSGDLGNETAMLGKIDTSSEMKGAAQEQGENPAAPNLQLLMNSVNFNLPDLKNILEKIKQAPAPSPTASVKVEDVAASSSNNLQAPENKTWQPDFEEPKRKQEDNSSQWEQQQQWNKLSAQKFMDDWNSKTEHYNNDNNIERPHGSNIGEDVNRHSDLSQAEKGNEWKTHESHDRSRNWASHSHGSKDNRGSDWRSHDMKHSRDTHWNSQGSQRDVDTSWNAQGTKHDQDSDWKSYGSKNDSDSEWRSHNSKSDRGGDYRSRESRRERESDWKSYGSQYDRGSHSDRKSRGSQHNKESDWKDYGSRYDRDSDRRSHSSHRDRESDWRSPGKHDRDSSRKSHRSPREKDWKSHGSQYDRGDEWHSGGSQYDRDDDRKSYGSHDRDTDRKSRGSHFDRDDDWRSRKSQQERSSDRRSRDSQYDSESDRTSHGRERKPQVVHEVKDQQELVQDAEQKQTNEQEDERRKHQISYKDLSQWKPTVEDNSNDSWSGQKKPEDIDRQQKSEFSVNTPGLRNILDKFKQFIPTNGPSMDQGAGTASRSAFSINTPDVQNILEKCKQMTQGTGQMGGVAMNPYDMYSQSNVYGMQGTGYPNTQSNYPYDPMSIYGDVDYRQQGQMTGGGQYSMDMDYRQQLLQQQMAIDPFTQAKDEKAEEARREQRRKNRKSRWGAPVMTPADLAQSKPVFSTDMIHNPILHVLNQTKVYMEMQKALEAEEEAKQKREQTRQSGSQNRRRKDNKGSGRYQYGKDITLGESDSDLSNISCEGSYVSDLDNMEDFVSQQYYKTEDGKVRNEGKSGQGEQQNTEDGKETSSGRSRQTKKTKVKRDMIGYTKRRKKRGRKAATTGTADRGDEEASSNDTVSVSGSELAVSTASTQNTDSQNMEWAPQPIEAFGLKSWHEAIPDPRFQPCIQLDNCKDKIEDLLQNLKNSAVEKTTEEASNDSLEKDYSKTVTSHTEAKKKYIIVKEEKDDGTFVITAKSVDDEPLNDVAVNPDTPKGVKRESEIEGETPMSPAKIVKEENETPLDIEAIRKMAQERKEQKKVRLQQETENRSGSVNADLPTTTDASVDPNTNMKRKFDIFNAESYSQPLLTDNIESFTDTEKATGLSVSDLVGSEIEKKEEQTTKELEPEKPAMMRKVSQDNELICDDVSRPVKHLFTEKDFTKAKIVLKLKSKPTPVLPTNLLLSNEKQTESYGGSQISVIGSGNYAGMTSSTVEESQTKQISSLVSKKAEQSGQILTPTPSSVQSRESRYVHEQPTSAPDPCTLSIPGLASRAQTTVPGVPIPSLNQPQTNPQQSFLTAEKEKGQNVRARDASPVPNVTVPMLTNISGQIKPTSTVHLPQPPIQNIQQRIPGLQVQQPSHPIPRMTLTQSNLPISQVLLNSHAPAHLSMNTARSPVPVLTSSSFPPPPIHSGSLSHPTTSVPSVHIAQPPLVSIRGPPSSHLLPPAPTNLQPRPSPTLQPPVPNIGIPPPALPNVRLPQPPGQNVRVPPPTLPNVPGLTQAGLNIKVPPPNFNAVSQVPNTQSFHGIPSHQNTTPAIHVQQTMSSMASLGQSIPTTLSTSLPPPGIQMMVRERPPPMPTPQPNLPHTMSHPGYMARPPFPQSNMHLVHRPPMPQNSQQHSVQGQGFPTVYSAAGSGHVSYSSNLRQIPTVTSSIGRAPSRSRQMDSSHVMDWFADKFAPKKSTDTGGGESSTKQETSNQSADLWKIAFDSRYSSGRSGESSQGNQADHFLGDSCQHHQSAGAANPETDMNLNTSTNKPMTETCKTVEEIGNVGSDFSLRVAAAPSPLTEENHDSLLSHVNKEDKRSRSRSCSQSHSNLKRQDVSRSHSNTPTRSESRSRSTSETKTLLDDCDKNDLLTESFNSLPNSKHVANEQPKNETKVKTDKKVASRSRSTSRSKLHYRKKSRSRTRSRSQSKSHHQKQSSSLSRSYQRKSGSKSLSKKKSRSRSRSHTRSRSKSYSRGSRSRSRSHRRRSRSRSWSRSYYRRSRSRSYSKKSRSHRKRNKSHYRRSRSRSPYRRNSGSRSKKIYRRNSRSGSDSRRKTRSRTRSRSKSRSRSNSKSEKSKNISNSLGYSDERKSQSRSEFTKNSISKPQSSPPTEPLEKTASDLEEGEVLDSNDSESLSQSGNLKISLPINKDVEVPATGFQNLFQDKQKFVNEAEPKEIWKSNRIKSVGIAWSQMLKKTEKNTESFYMEQHRIYKKVKPKVTQEESSESDNDESLSGCSQQDSDEEPAQSFFRNEQKIVVKLTLADWLKKELKRDEVGSLQKFILYPLSLDLAAIEKVKRRKIKRKVRKELEAQFFTFRRSCSPTEEREMSKGQIKQELAIVRQNLERVRGSPGIVPDNVSENSYESKKAGMNWINSSVSVSKSFADATCLTVSQDYQLRVALQEVESDMLLCAKNVATHGKPHCKVPDEILLKEERNTHFTKDGVFLILLHAISDKPYKRLLDMRKTLEQLKYDLYEASQRNDKRSLKSLKDQKNTINVQRRTLLLSFTGSLTRKRLRKLAITKEHYTLCYNHLKEPLEDELGIKLGFIKTMLDNIKSHFFIVQKEVV
ncbi:hypothetical protein ScPMuIL_004899 [Solemya velum]